MLRSVLQRNYAKIFKSCDEAVSNIKSNMTVLCGGFGVCGIPNSLIKAVTNRSDIKDLTCVSNNAGIETAGLGLLLNSGQTKRMISSYVGENKAFERLYLTGNLELELIPQGTLAEKIRAGGAGIPVFGTATGANTLVEHGGFIIKYGKDGKAEILSDKKDTYIDEKGRKYLLEKSIWGDVALIKAWKADSKGNLVYRKSARNFNQDMAKAADFVIAEVEEFVDEIDPNDVHTPCIYIDGLVKTEEPVKPIEKITTRQSMEINEDHLHNPKYATRVKIAKRAAQEIKDATFLNLGIGIPTWVPLFVPPEQELFMQGENGLLGLGGYPEEGQEDPDLIDPAKQTVIIRKNASFFSSSESFAMIRGGHLNYTLLGGMEVSMNGDLANWIIPGKFVKGMGGAMDLVSSKTTVIVLMEHTSKGTPKILEKCSLPITGKGCVNKIITELAVFEVKPEGGLRLTDIANETDLETVKKLTGCPFEVSSDLKKF